MSASQAEIERIISLKKLQETQQVLDEKTMQEKMRLEMKYKEYLFLTSQEMEQQQQQQEQQQNPQPISTTVKSNDMDPIIEDYKKLYSKESWYKEPESVDGKTKLTFPSKESVADFFQDQSSKNRSFVVIDGETKKVMAFSNGDGKLYHGNGSEFKKGDKLNPSGVDIEQFKMPEKEQESSMSLR